MKKVKLSFLKRIFLVFCCTLLLITSIFLSYNTAVHAADDYNLKDAVEDVLNVCLIVGGIIFTPPSGGLSLLATLKGVLGLTDSIENIYNYVTDNGDGTYTISEEFIQAALQAAEELDAQGFTDSDVKRQGEGTLQTYKWSVTNTYMYNHPYKTDPESHKDIYNKSGETNVRVAGVNEVLTDTDSNDRIYTIYYHSVYSYDSRYVFLSFSGCGTGYFTVDGNTSTSNIGSSTGDSLLLQDGSQKNDKYNGLSSFVGNFPIFSTLEAAKEYLETGKGYKDAENYREKPVFRRHSSYSPTYAGGSVTVNRTVINSIDQKIVEVDADDTLTDDEKIELIREYILSGGTGGNEDPDPVTPPRDPEEDTPAGTDLTDTNSWLKKIYLKVSAMFDGLKEHFTSLDKKLDDILKAIKGISFETTEDPGGEDDDTFDLDDMLKSILDNPETGSKEVADSLSESFGEVASGLTKKFPISIPWDLYALFSTLAGVSSSPEHTAQIAAYDDRGVMLNETYTQDNAQLTFKARASEAPCFELPIYLDSYGIHEVIEVDMARFQSLATFSRTMFAIIFGVLLLRWTITLLSAISEIMPDLFNSDDSVK